jgi:signal transduction histidine kinase
MGPWTASPPDALLATMTVVTGQLGQFFERKRAEREAERLKDEFIALVSHELRTPLTSILGYLEILSDEEAGPLVAEQRRFLEVLDRNARRLLRLVGDLLFIAQFESGRFALDAVSEVDLGDLAVEALRAAQPSADDQGIGIALSCAPNRSTLCGDRDRLSQVLDNLISNALKFTAAGGSVKVNVLQQAGEAVIEVTDTGIGIPESEQERLFQRFFRASSASQRHIAGVGLGLSIVRAIVEAHGGSIECHSLQGAGTTFRVRLPLASRADPAARPPAPPRQNGVAAMSMPHDRKGMAL